MPKGNTMKAENGAIKYEIGLFKKIIRIILSLMQTILPQTVFLAFYDRIRSIYQSTGNAVYVLKTSFFSISADKETRIKYVLTRRLLPYTMGGWKAMHNAFEIVALAEKLNISGALVECGVARGGTSAMMAMANLRLGKEERIKWLFDSYEGLPSPGPSDFRNGKVGEVVSPLGAGDCIGTEAEVRYLMLDKLEFSPTKVNLVKGWFEKTVPATKKDVGAIAILRLDGDWYESTKVPLENFYDQITKGGLIIIDDYATCYGSQLAVDEFLEGRSLSCPLNPDGRGGVWFQKLV